MRARSLVVTATLATATLTIAASAGAYVWFKTEGGAPVRWKRSMLTMATSTVAPEELDASSIPSAVSRAFDTWEATGCVPAMTITGTTDAVSGSRPATTTAEPDNVFVFIRTKADWARRGHGATEIAVTLLSSNDTTGEIVDADMEVNDGGYRFSLDESPPSGTVDFIGTITHEAGHFYGLDHAPDRDSIMFANADPTHPGSKRELIEDDIDGVCDLYAAPWPTTPTPPDDDCSAGAQPGLAAAVAALAARALARRRAR